VKKNSTSKKSVSNQFRPRGTADTEIDLSDIPEITPAQFARAVVRRGLKPITKRQLTLRLDSDVIDWFRAQGSGYQTQMNALLRAYMLEQSKAAASRARVTARRAP
jgi:uncharacterized protein (DUF4415 family)